MLAQRVAVQTKLSIRNQPRQPHPKAGELRRDFLLLFFIFRNSLYLKQKSPKKRGDFILA